MQVFSFVPIALQTQRSGEVRLSTDSSVPRIYVHAFAFTQDDCLHDRNKRIIFKFDLPDQLVFVVDFETGTLGRSTLLRPTVMG